MDWSPMLLFSPRMAITTGSRLSRFFILNGHRPSLRQLARAAFQWNDGGGQKKSAAFGTGSKIGRSQHQGNHSGVFKDDHIGVEKSVSVTMVPEKISVRCCIAGGGPAGMMLGYLLARAGVNVLMLEKHGDFLRDFRGDTIHPSTLEVMHELDCSMSFSSCRIRRFTSSMRKLARCV
jgi:hypothetical protein